jgi:glycosyltransferase involved in cell wall biosynthesis
MAEDAETVTFSVITPAYKMGAYIGAALDSVGAQSCRDWEVIVVDGCAPDDGTREIVEKFATRFPGHRVEFIRHEENTGVSGARNTAIQAARGEFLAFLDPDDLWLPEYLATIARLLYDDPATDVVSTPPIGIWEVPGKSTFPDFIQFQDWQISRFPSSLSVSNFLQPSSTVVRKARVMETGGFDTERTMQHIEDYDLWIRLVGSGAAFTFINENLTKYRKHPGAATSDIRRMNELHERLVTKHAAFFINSQRHMIWALMRESRALRRAVNNPIRWLLRKFIVR